MLALEILSLALGIVATVGGGIAWYRGSVVKQYAAQEDFKSLQKQLSELATLRDLKHFQRSLDQLSSNVATLSNELEDLNKVAIEQKAMIQAIWARIEAIAARLDIATSGWSNRSDKGQ